MAKAVGVLLLVATIINLSNSLKATFTITPPETSVGKTGSFKCASSNDKNIQSWIIKKGPELVLQYDQSYQFVHQSLAGRVHIFDKIDLIINIDAVKCEDDGNYTCIIRQDSDTLISNSIIWTVKDSAKDVTMTATFIDLKRDGEIEIVALKPIHLLCQGYLGNPVGNMEWYIATVGLDEDIKESDYKNTTTNVTMTEAKPVEDSCQMTQKSSIKFYPTNSMKVGIRCKVKNELGEESNEKIFKIMNPVDSDKVSKTLIIIIVLAVIIPEIIIAIILGIVLYIRKKRQKKKRELEAAEAEEKAALPDRQSRNSFQMKQRNSSKGGRRKRDSSMKEKADAPEKQAMTGYEDDPEA